MDQGIIKLKEEMPRDSIVDAVIKKFQERSEVGIKKYGVTLDREDLSVLDWIQHAQEEHMDAILYLEKLKKESALRDEQIQYLNDIVRVNDDTIDRYTKSNELLFFIFVFIPIFCMSVVGFILMIRSV